MLFSLGWQVAYERENSDKKTNAEHRCTGGLAHNGSTTLLRYGDERDNNNKNMWNDQNRVWGTQWAFSSKEIIQLLYYLLVVLVTNVVVLMHNPVKISTSFTWPQVSSAMIWGCPNNNRFLSLNKLLFWLSQGRPSLNTEQELCVGPHFTPKCRTIVHTSEFLTQAAASHRSQYTHVPSQISWSNFRGEETERRSRVTHLRFRMHRFDNQNVANHC